MSAKTKKRIVLKNPKRAYTTLGVLAAVLLLAVFFVFRGCAAADPVQNKIEASEGQKVKINRKLISSSTPEGGTVTAGEKLTFKLVYYYQLTSNNALKPYETNEYVELSLADNTANASLYNEYTIEISATAAAGETVEITAQSKTCGVEPIVFRYTVAETEAATTPKAE